MLVAARKLKRKQISALSGTLNYIFKLLNLPVTFMDIPEKSTPLLESTYYMDESPQC